MLLGQCFCEKKKVVEQRHESFYEQIIDRYKLKLNKNLKSIE